MQIRTHFPPYGANRYGGTSNGLTYETAFEAKTLLGVYEMLSDFLAEEGYADIDISELLAFRSSSPCTGNHVILERCPIKITVLADRYPRICFKLILFNEHAPEFEQRFAGTLDKAYEEGLINAQLELFEAQFGVF